MAVLVDTMIAYRDDGHPRHVKLASSILDIVGMSLTNVLVEIGLLSFITLLAVLTCALSSMYVFPVIGV